MKTQKPDHPSIPATAMVLASDITGSRFTIDTISPQLQDLVGFHADGHVTKSVAAELKKLLNGQRTGILQKNDGKRAKLYLTSQPGGKTKLHQIDIVLDLTHIDGYMGHLFSAQAKSISNAMATWDGAFRCITINRPGRSQATLASTGAGRNCAYSGAMK